MRQAAQNACADLLLRERTDGTRRENLAPADFLQRGETPFAQAPAGTTVSAAIERKAVEFLTCVWNDRKPCEAARSVRL
jgi:hypothetical protein